MSGRGPSARRARRWSRSLPAGTLDAAGVVLRPPVTAIHGWAIAEEGLGRVEVEVGDRSAVRARPLAIPRPVGAGRSAQASAPIDHAIDAYRDLLLGLAEQALPVAGATV